MSELADMLDANLFVTVYKGILVNLQYIYNIENIKTKIQTSHGFALKIGRGRPENLHGRPPLLNGYTITNRT